MSVEAERYNKCHSPACDPRCVNMSVSTRLSALIEYCMYVYLRVYLQHTCSYIGLNEVCNGEEY